MVKFLILAYIFFVSWTSALALSSWILLPFVFVLSAFVVVLFKVIRGSTFCVSPYYKEDLFLPLFFIFFMVSAIINMNASGFNYVVAYLFVFGLLYLFVKGVLATYVTLPQIYMANTYGVIFVGLFLTVNFILNTSGIVDLQGAIPRISGTNASYLGIFNRGYAFATEPGIVAFYLNTLGPLALWHLWCEVQCSKVVKLLLTCAVAFGWLVLFSAAAVFFLSISCFLAAMIMWKRIINRRLTISTFCKMGSVTAFILLISLFFAFSPKFQGYIAPICMKLTLSPELSSSHARTDRWKNAANLVLDEPFLGKGPRYFSSKGESSAISWYLTLLVEGGFLSFMPLLAFLCIVFVRILTFRHLYQPPILIGFLAGCGHLMIISSFFAPFLWLLIAIFYVLYAEKYVQVEMESVYA